MKSDIFFPINDGLDNFTNTLELLVDPPFDDKNFCDD